MLNKVKVIPHEDIPPSPDAGIVKIVSDKYTSVIPSDGILLQDIYPVNISKDFSKEALIEVGKKPPYYRYIDFPIEITEKITT